MATQNRDPEKTVDVPPYGRRNPDPVTDQPGSHPVETGVGAVLGGVASGLAVGAAGGPVGAVIGGIAGGAAAGGLAGKGVGELIDPTTEDNWLREYHEASTRAGEAGGAADDYRPAYRHGIAAAADAPRPFEAVEADIRSRYESTRTPTSLPWDRVRGAVHDAYHRTIRLHAERLAVGKTSRVVGVARVRTEVVTEQKTITVPVRKEVLVVEQHPGTGGDAAGGDGPAVPLRIQLREERLVVTKEVAVYEEVTVGKKVVTEQKTVGADLRREELVTAGTATAGAPAGRE